MTSACRDAGDMVPVNGPGAPAGRRLFSAPAGTSGVPLRIVGVRFTAAPKDARARGLLGWVSATVGESLHLDGIAVRRTRDGRLTLSFPSRRDAAGVDHPIIRPIDNAARCWIEEQVFAALPTIPEDHR